MRGHRPADQCWRADPLFFSLEERIKHLILPDRLYLHAVALSNESGTAELILPIQRSGRYFNQGATLQTRKLPPGKGFGVTRVKQRRLDEYRFADVTFIKIDVEGYEFEVIEGARETLGRERPTLLVEINVAYSKTSRDETISAISNNGYDCFYVSTTNLCHISRFDHDTEKSRTDNFVFLPVDDWSIFQSA